MPNNKEPDCPHDLSPKAWAFIRNAILGASALLVLFVGIALWSWLR